MKRLLIVVDYQNDFVSGSLATPEAGKIEKGIISLIDEAKKNHDFVCFTKDTHDEYYLKTIEGQNLPISHCKKGTWGWELTDLLKTRVDFYPVFEKNGFYSYELGNYIKGLSPIVDEIQIVGLVSEYCVFAAATTAKACASPYCRIAVLKDYVKCISKEDEAKSFEMLKHLHVEVK